MQQFPAALHRHRWCHAHLIASCADAILLRPVQPSIPEHYVATQTPAAAGRSPKRQLSLQCADHSDGFWLRKRESSRWQPPTSAVILRNGLPHADALVCRRSQDDRCELDPLTASVHKLAHCVYPKDPQLAVSAIASALSGFGVALYKGVIMELKVPRQLASVGRNVRANIEACQAQQGYEAVAVAKAQLNTPQGVASWSRTRAPRDVKQS